MATLEPQFNSRVSAFLGRTGMKPTTLGMRAVGDPGLSRSTIYRWRVADRFPPPLVMGGRTVGWIEWDVDAWIRERAMESRGGGTAIARRPQGGRRRR